MTRRQSLRRWTFLAGMALAPLLVPSSVSAQVEPEGAPDAVLRPVVGGTRGMVASNHPAASMAGVEVMIRGGNAFDAAIAVGAALGVVEPMMSGLGGVGWMILYAAETGETHVLNFGGRSPSALSASHFQDRIGNRGPLVALVPGSAAAWEALSKRFGTMAPDALMEPAIRLARDGYTLTAFGAARHAEVATVFQDWDRLGARAWWGGNDTPPRQGDIVRNPDLAATYERLAREGYPAFYRGETAREIAGAYQKYGGVLTEEDLAGYEVSWEAPIRTTYRGNELLGAAPNSSGGLAILQIMKILEGYDVRAMGLNTPEYIHHVVEATKLAAEDRARWAGDPDFMDERIPLDRLLSPEYAAEQRRRITPQRAAFVDRVGENQVGTTHYTVADGQGNMVAVTTTMGGGFGAGLVGGRSGVLLNNGVSWFELDPESPAFVEGGKRTRWNMGPTLVARDGVPFLALGTPGGTTIWQTQPQLLTKILDFGMDLQAAIESPRFRWELGGRTVRLEGRIPSPVLEGLEGLGHDAQHLVDWTSGVGGMNAIRIDRATGFLTGGADPRRDGYVIGW
jgi:gamma-glutamyltranspeptidase